MSLPRLRWRLLMRHWLQVQAFCCVIAVVTTAVWPRNGYVNQLVYASLIGLPDVGALLILRLARFFKLGRYSPGMRSLAAALKAAMPKAEKIKKEKPKAQAATRAAKGGGKK